MSKRLREYGTREVDELHVWVSMKKFILYILMMLLLMNLSGCAAADKGNQVQSFDDIDAVPVFASQDLDGNDISSDIFVDYELTVLNIWATS